MTTKNLRHAFLSAMAVIALSFTCSSDTFTHASARENHRTVTRIVPVATPQSAATEALDTIVESPIQAPEVWGSTTIRHDWRCRSCPVTRRNEVLQLERALNTVVDQYGQRFYDAPMDGVYGRALDVAVGKFQRALGLKTRDGGVYNNETFLALSRVLYDSNRANARAIAPVERQVRAVETVSSATTEFGPEISDADFDNAPTPVIEPLTESDDDFLSRLRAETSDTVETVNDVVGSRVEASAKIDMPIKPTTASFGSASIEVKWENREGLSPRFRNGVSNSSRR